MAEQKVITGSQEGAALPPPASAPTRPNLPQAEPAPIADLGPTPQRYRHELAKFISSGIPVEPVPAVVINRSDPQNFSPALASAGLLFSFNYRQTINDFSPLQHIINGRGQDRDVLPPLPRSTKPLEAPVYQMALEPVKGSATNEKSIVISDALLGNEVAVMPAAAFTGGGPDREETIKNAVQKLLRYDKANHQLHKETIAKLPLSKPDQVAVISQLGTKPLPEGALPALKKVLGSEHTISIGAADNGRPFDAERGREFTAQTLPNSPLLVRGPITQIAFSFGIDGSGVKQFTDRSYSTSRPDGQAIFVDNIVVPGEKTIGYYKISPPLPLLKPGADTNKQFSVPIYLGPPIGSGQMLEGVIFQTGILPQAKIGNTLVYSTIEPGLFRSVVEPRLRDVRAGVNKAEMLFGASSGAFCENILVVPTRTEGAYYAPKDSKTIVIPPNSMTTPVEARYSAFHESIHLIDRAVGSELSIAVGKVMNGLAAGRGSFIEVINERNFLPGANPHAGHAADNSSELLASLMTSSFNHPQWRERTELLTTEQLSDYKKVLGAVRAGAAKVDEKAADTGWLRTRLEKFEKDIDEMLKEER